VEDRERVARLEERVGLVHALAAGWVPHAH
jgi:hypothetical protein